jgi:hypothetical protein
VFYDGDTIWQRMICQGVVRVRVGSDHGASRGRLSHGRGGTKKRQQLQGDKELGIAIDWIMVRKRRPEGDR